MDSRTWIIFPHSFIFHILSCIIPFGTNTLSAGGSPKQALIGVTLIHPFSMAQLSEPSGKEDGGRSIRLVISGENLNTRPPIRFGETSWAACEVVSAIVVLVESGPACGLVCSSSCACFRV